MKERTLDAIFKDVWSLWPSLTAMKSDAGFPQTVYPLRRRGLVPDASFDTTLIDRAKVVESPLTFEELRRYREASKTAAAGTASRALDPREGSVNYA